MVLILFSGEIIVIKSFGIFKYDAIIIEQINLLLVHIFFPICEIEVEEKKKHEKYSIYCRVFVFINFIYLLGMSFILYKSTHTMEFRSLSD